MKELPDLKQLTEEAKDALIVELWEKLQKLEQQAGKKPKKTWKNSSLPPAQGFKADIKREEQSSKEQRVGSVGREGGGRQLSEYPDEIIKSTVKSCVGCGREMVGSIQTLMERYEKIDIPQIKPTVTRIEKYGCKYEECEQEDEKMYSSWI